MDEGSEVLVGSDGYLFLIGGGQKLYEYISGNLKVAKKSYEIFNSNISSRAEICFAKNVKYIHTIAPDKQTVLPEYFPEKIVVPVGQSFIESSDLGKHIYFPDKDLIALSKSIQICQRTDSHLSDLASLYYAGMLVEKISGISQNEIVKNFLEFNHPLIKSISGDLGSKFNPNIFSDEQQFPDPVLQNMKWVSNNLGGGNNGIVDLRMNDAAKESSRVIVFGTSSGRALSKWLSLFYSEVLFFRTPFFHKELFEALKPDIVISQNIERYLPSSLSDENATSFFEFKNLQAESYQPSDEFKNTFRKFL